MCAIAVMALGAPSLERSRRNLAPKARWLRSRAEAASRNAVEARLTTCRVPRLSTLPPLMRLSGHKPSQEAKCSFWHHLQRPAVSCSEVIYLTG